MDRRAENLDPRENHFLIPGPRCGLRLFLRHLAPERVPERRRVVLYVHGATFPSALSIAHRFGASDRYPEMDQPADAHPPLCRAADAAEQIAAAARFILEHHAAARLSIIA